MRLEQKYIEFEGPVVAGGPILQTIPGETIAGRLPVFTYGSGAPSISAPKGSLYIRTDGSSASTRIYVNSDGAATWVAVTTAS